MSDVPRSLQSWVSIIHTVVLKAGVFQLFINLLLTLVLGYVAYGIFFVPAFWPFLHLPFLSSFFYIFYKNIEKHQLWVRPMAGWNSTSQAAWYVRHAYWARMCYVPLVMWCLLIAATIIIWLLILSSTSFMVGRSRVFYTYSSWNI